MRGKHHGGSEWPPRRTSARPGDSVHVFLHLDPLSLPFSFSSLSPFLFLRSVKLSSQNTLISFDLQLLPLNPHPLVVYDSNAGALQMSSLTHFDLFCQRAMISCVRDWPGGAPPPSKAGPSTACPSGPLSLGSRLEQEGRRLYKSTINQNAARLCRAPSRFS